VTTVYICAGIYAANTDRTDEKVPQPLTFYALTLN